MFIVDEDQIEKIYNNIKDITINSFEGTTIINPALDIGDKIIIDGKPILYQGEITLNGRFVANIKSKIDIKQKQETTVKKESQKLINRRVQSEINQVEGKITQLIEETTENTEKITKQEQTIEGITQSVSEVEVKVTTAQTSADKAQSTADTANQNAQNAQTTADNINNNLEENYYTKTETKSQIKQESDSITSQVNKTISTAKQEAIDSANSSTDEKLENYSTTEETNSMIEQKADSITLEVNKTVENIQIGGTNLIKNSAPYNMNNWVRNGATLSLVDESTAPFGKAIKIYFENDTQSGGYNSARKIEVGKQHSWSVWIKASKQIKMSIGQEQNGSKVVDVGTTWQRYTHTYTSDNNEYNAFIFYVQQPYRQAGLEVYVHSIKLEEGNKPTAWSPSPEDTATKVEMNSAIEQTAESINLEVSKKVGNDEIISKINQTPESVTINANKFNINGAVSANGNFKVDTNGNMTCTNGTFTGGNIELYDTVGENACLNMSSDGYMSSYSSHNIWLSNANMTDYFEGIFADLTESDEPIFMVRNRNEQITIISGSGIETPQVNINGEGYAMYGKNSHKYRCNWTGSQLQFWVDETNVGTLSDKRLKTEIQDIDEDFIKAIKEVEMKQFKIANRNGLISFGILAQDLIEIFKKYNKNPFDYEIVQETQYRTDDDTIYYTINYEQYLILKTKAQDKEIQQLQEKDEQKDELIQSLIERIEKLEGGAK